MGWLIRMSTRDRCIPRWWAPNNCGLHVRSKNLRIFGFVLECSDVMAGRWCCRRELLVYTATINGLHALKIQRVCGCIDQPEGAIATASHQYCTQQPKKRFIEWVLCWNTKKRRTDSQGGHTGLEGLLFYNWYRLDGTSRWCWPWWIGECARKVLPSWSILRGAIDANRCSCGCRRSIGWSIWSIGCFLATESYLSSASARAIRWKPMLKFYTSAGESRFYSRGHLYLHSNFHWPKLIEYILWLTISAGRCCGR